METSGLPSEDPLTFEVMFGISIGEQSAVPQPRYPSSDPGPGCASGLKGGYGGEVVTGLTLELLPVLEKGGGPAMPEADKPHGDRCAIRDLQAKNLELEKSQFLLRQQLVEKERELRQNQQAITEEFSERIQLLEEDKQREIEDLRERLGRIEQECEHLREELRAVQGEMERLRTRNDWENSVARSATHYMADMQIDMAMWFGVRVLLAVLAFASYAQLISS